MSNAQRIIKYLALAFAWFLIFSIFSAIAIGISSIGTIFNDKNTNEKLSNIDINGEYSILKIDISASKLIIKEGKKLKAETNNKYINCRQEDNKLIIEEEKHNIFKNDDSELVVYLPKDFIFDSVSIDTGAGKVDINELITKQLYLNLGAGRTKINNLIIYNNGEINGGAGEIIIDNGEINNLKLNMGVGRLELNTLLTGKNKIESGIGELDLNLVGTKDDYKISIDKGIGSATIDGINQKDDSSYGSGNNLIDIDGGIGQIKINLINKEKI